MGRAAAGVGDEGSEGVVQAGVVAHAVEPAEGGVQLVGVAGSQIVEAADAEADQVAGDGGANVGKLLERTPGLVLLSAEAGWWRLPAAWLGANWPSACGVRCPLAVSGRTL